MNRKEKAARIQTILNEYYPSPKVPLSHSSPYTLLIAVLLSAQCTDVRVNQITPKLFSKAKTPEGMIKLTIPEIEAIIRPCGLGPSKAKAIWQLSNQIIHLYKGEVPQTFEELESFPGVGHKTASVVMSQAFGIPAFPVDTHIHRCAKRWGLSSGASVKETEEDLKKLFPKSLWNTLHLQIIYFARQFCKSRGHSINECPICSLMAHPLS